MGKKTNYTFPVRMIVGFGENPNIKGVTVLFEDGDETAGSISAYLDLRNKWIRFIDGNEAEIDLIRHDYTSTTYDAWDCPVSHDQTEWLVSELRIPRTWQFPH